MAKRVQFRRGTSTEHSSFTGALGEITVDTTLKTIRVHDNVKVGGDIIATQDFVEGLNNTTVKLTGNQTIAGTKTFSSNIVGNVTGSVTGKAGTATKLQTARTINGVSFDGSNNITVSDATAVKLTGNQTIAGVKTFSSTIGGSINGNSATATKLATARTINGVAFDGTAGILISDATAVKLTGNQTIAGVKTFSSSPVVPNPITNTQAANKAYVDSQSGVDNVKIALNASGTAPIYACRAWVNFTGIGTVTIRASGNVSSVTDNGVGLYTVNFITAMPDVNYTYNATAKSSLRNNVGFIVGQDSDDIYTTTQLGLHVAYNNAVTITLYDSELVTVSVVK